MLHRYIAQEKRFATGKRLAAAKAALRIERGVDAETLRRRALDDARGQVVRQGCTYRATGVVHWIVRRALAGRTDQFEFIANGRVKLLGGRRLFPVTFRP